MDALLGALDRLIAKKRDLKQAAMQQLLTGQTRLPGFHGEWEVKTAGGSRRNIDRWNTYSRAKLSDRRISSMDALRRTSHSSRTTDRVKSSARITSFDGAPSHDACKSFCAYVDRKTSIDGKVALRDDMRRCRVHLGSVRVRIRRS